MIIQDKIMKKIIIRNKKKAIITIIVLITFLSILSFFREGEKDFASSNDTILVLGENILNFSDNQIKISTSGKIESEDQINILSEVSGTIENVFVSIGERVFKDQILANLNTEEVEYRLLQAEAGFLAQKARFDEVYSGNIEEVIKIRESAVLSANTLLENTKKKTEDTVKNSRENLLNNDLRAYVSDLSNYDDLNFSSPTITGVYTSNKEGEYIVSIYRSGRPSGYSFRYKDPEGRMDSGPVAVGVPQKLGEDGLYIQFPLNFENNVNIEWIIPIPNYRSATYLTFKNIYENALREKDPSIIQAEELLRQREQELLIALSGNREEQIASQRALLKQAEAGFLLAKSNFKKYIIKSPFDGIITTLPIRSGNLIMPGQEILSIFGENKKRIIAYISPDKSKILSIGDKVIIKDKYKGEVSAISKGLNSRTNQIEIWITLNDIDNSLIIGEYLSVDIFANTEDDIFFLPLSSINVSSMGSAIFTIEDEVIKRVPILTGSIEGEKIAVLEGLENISSIILNASLVKAGQKAEFKVNN